MWALWLNMSRFSLAYVVVEASLYLLIGRYYIPGAYVAFQCVSFVAIT